MRVGHFVSVGLGGADKAAFNLALCLAKRPDVEQIVFYNTWSIPRRVEGNHNPGYTPPSRLRHYSAITKPILIQSVAEFNNYGLDILQVHRSGEDHWLLPGLEDLNPKFKIVETNFHGVLGTLAHARIYPSQELAIRTQNRTPFRVIPNPIWPPRTAKDLRGELGIEGKFVFGRLARPDADISCNISLEAYRRIEDDSTVFLYAAPHDSAKATASRLGIRNVVYANTTINNTMVSRIYNTLDVHCHSNNIGETFGNSIAEAMIHGKPTVAHRGLASHWCQAHKALFGDMVKYYVEDAGTEQMIEHYASLMRELKNDPAAYAEASDYALKRANELYRADVVTDQYVAFYKEVLG